MKFKFKPFLGTEIPAIDSVGLRQFGLIFGGIIATVFGLVVPLLFTHSLAWWPWVVATGFLVISLIKPNLLSNFYEIWMRFGTIMSMIMSRIILGAVFLLAVIPTALILKMKRADILGLKLDDSLQSYRKQSSPLDPDHMKKPY